MFLVAMEGNSRINSRINIFSGGLVNEDSRTIKAFKSRIYKLLETLSDTPRPFNLKCNRPSRSHYSEARCNIQNRKKTIKEKILN